MLLYLRQKSPYSTNFYFNFLKLNNVKKDNSITCSSKLVPEEKKYCDVRS